MKKFKKIIALVAVVGILSMAGIAYAADFKTPAQIVAALTGRTVDDVTAERTDGKTYGTIANEAGVLDEFKVQMLEQKKAILDQRVADGLLTQQQADDIYNTIKQRQAACDGTGSVAGGRCGTGLGQGRGFGMGRGAGRGNGFGGGMGGYIGR